MGLASAFHAVKAGHTVEVWEAALEPGGMAAHFDLAGLSIERFYHFVCKSDTSTMELMSELGIGNQMRWRVTLYGNFYQRRAARLGNTYCTVKVQRDQRHLPIKVWPVCVFVRASKPMGRHRDGIGTLMDHTMVWVRSV